jgi:hypothetical protein
MRPDSLRHPRHWLLAARAACALALARILLGVAPGWTLAKLRRAPVQGDDIGRAGVERIADAVWTIAGRAPAASCLPRSVAIAVLARRAGARAQLVIGVRREHESVAAHAWVEHRGQPVPAQEVGAYTRLWETP